MIDVLARKCNEALEISLAEGEGGEREEALLRELEQLDSALRRGPAEAQSGCGSASRTPSGCGPASRTPSDNSSSADGESGGLQNDVLSLAVESKEDVEIVLRYFEDTEIVGSNLTRRHGLRMVLLLICMRFFPA